LEWKDVILAGRGQGAFTAIKLGISIKIPNIKAIISFNGFYNPNGDFPINEEKGNTPILWANGAKDKVFDEKKKTSYRLLKKKHFDPKIITMPHSTHDELSLKDINRVIRELKQMGIYR